MADEVELTIEQRLDILEDKLAYLWAGNPPHPADLPKAPEVGAEFPKQVGTGDDAVVVNSADEEAKVGKQPSA